MTTSKRLFRVNWSFNDRNDDDFRIGNYLFEMNENVPEGQEETALRNAVYEYYDNLPEDSEELNRGYNPNWGDAICDIPSEHWEKHGLKFIDGTSTVSSINVHHDEHVWEKYSAD